MEKLYEILSNIFQINVDKISDDITMEDIERWDSLTHMKLVVALEENYNIELNVEQIIAMKSVKAIKEIIYKKDAA